MEKETFMDGLSFSVKSVFLLLLTLMSSYFKKYLGPHINKLLKTNTIIINLLLFSFIYFAITLTNFQNKKSELLHPYVIFKLSLGIYVFFILFGNLEYYSTIIVLFLLLVAYLNYTFYYYYKKSKHIEKFKQHKKIQNMLYYSIITVLLIGFLLNKMK